MNQTFSNNTFGRNAQTASQSAPQQQSGHAFEIQIESQPKNEEALPETIESTEVLLKHFSQMQQSQHDLLDWLKSTEENEPSVDTYRYKKIR